MIKYIKGCLIKFGEPFPNGVYIDPSAIDKTKVTKLPVTPHFYDHSNIIGYCDLDYRDDGIYYIFYPAQTDKAKEALAGWDHDNYIGVYCNKVVYATDNKKKVIHAELVSAARCIGLELSPSAYVEQVVFDVGGETT